MFTKRHDCVLRLLHRSVSPWICPCADSRNKNTHDNSHIIISKQEIVVDLYDELYVNPICSKTLLRPDMMVWDSTKNMDIVELTCCEKPSRKNHWASKKRIKYNPLLVEAKNKGWNPLLWTIEVSSTDYSDSLPLFLETVTKMHRVDALKVSERCVEEFLQHPV